MPDGSDVGEPADRAAEAAAAAGEVRAAFVRGGLSDPATLDRLSRLAEHGLTPAEVDREAERLRHLGKGPGVLATHFGGWLERRAVLAEHAVRGGTAGQRQREAEAEAQRARAAADSERQRAERERAAASRAIAAAAETAPQRLHEAAQRALERCLPRARRELEQRHPRDWPPNMRLAVAAELAKPGGRDHENPAAAEPARGRLAAPQHAESEATR